MEDDPDVLHLVQLALSKAGYAVVPATNGRSALDLAFAHRPDLTILDVVLPALDGLAVLDRLRADSRTAAMPVVLLTASAYDNQVEEGLCRGATCYLKKPFVVRDLVATVRAVTPTMAGTGR